MLVILFIIYSKPGGAIKRAFIRGGQRQVYSEGRRRKSDRGLPARIRWGVPSAETESVYAARAEAPAVWGEGTRVDQGTSVTIYRTKIRIHKRQVCHENDKKIYIS